MRYVVDGSWQRFARVVIAGSPLRIFRLTARGAEVAADLEVGTGLDSGVEWSPSVDGSVDKLLDRLVEAGAIHAAPDAGRPATHGASDVTIVTPQFGGAIERNDDDNRSIDGGRGIDGGRVLVDDGSDPPLDGATLRLAINRGPGAARNAGRMLVTTALVAFVDADVDLGDGWLVPLVAHFDDPRVGLVAPRVAGERGSPLDLGASPARIRAGTRVSYVPGAAIVVRVDAFDAIGGFDEQMRIGEDVDLVWRLDEAGWRCRYEPASSVWHQPRATRRDALRQHATYGASAAPLALRHPHSLAPLTSNGWTAAAWAMLAAGHPLAAAGVALGSATMLVRRLPDVPATVTFGLAIRGHVGAARQLAAGIRRVWWPIVFGGAAVSRRLRWIGVAAVLTDPRSTPTDMAYGWGVWRSMLRHRTATPIIPRLTAWPPKSRVR